MCHFNSGIFFHCGNDIISLISDGLQRCTDKMLFFTSSGHTYNGAPCILLTISAASNTTDNVRNSKITVETAGDKQEIAVHQAFSWETVLLSTTASEEISLDSEGESVLFTVVSNGQWSVTSDADWVSVESDPVSGTVRVGAPRNPDAHRNATLTVRATKGSATESCKVTVSQISREENPYYQMLGYYGLHAENWYYGREPIGVSGTGTFCTVEEKEYRKSFYIKNLFLTGTVVEATYDKNTQTMSIELGRLCYTREISPTVSRFHYLYSINMQGGGFHNGMLTGRLGEGYNDDADETRKAILLNGFESPYTTLGIIGYQEQQWLSTCKLNLTPENINAGKFDVCLEYHIKNCKGPCIGRQSHEDYMKDIREIKEILKGDITDCLLGRVAAARQR